MRSQLVFAGLLAALGACSQNKQVAVASPTSAYVIAGRVNRTDDTRTDYADVVLVLRNQKHRVLDSINSGAGDFSRWELGWMAHGDTVVLYSSDIGPQAWQIEQGKLKEIALDGDTVKYRPILKRAAQLRATGLKH